MCHFCEQSVSKELDNEIRMCKMLSNIEKRDYKEVSPPCAFLLLESHTE